MNIRKVSPDFSVSQQIDPRDMAAIAAAGYRSIVCNRPDGESADQPSFSEIEAAAAAAGLEARYIPVKPGAATDGAARSFADAFSSMPRPILAYCRSGARSAGLWSMLQDQLRHG